MKRSAFVKLLGRGSGVTSSSWRLNFVVAIFLLDQMSGRRRDMRRGLPSCGGWVVHSRCAATSCSFFGARYGNHVIGK